MENSDEKLKKTSSDSKVEKFELKLKVFDMNKIFADAQSKAMSELNANPSITKKEMEQKMLNYICDDAAAGKAKEQPQTINLSFTKEDKRWEPMEKYDGLEGVILDYIFIK